jgi:DNA-binding transcriptional regulator YiaG
MFHFIHNDDKNEGGLLIMNRYILPEDLKSWRLSQNLSRMKLSKLLKVSHSSIYRWERGTTKIPFYVKIVIHTIQEDLMFLEDIEDLGK